MGSTRRGDTSQLNNTYPSARPTLSSPLEINSPNPGSSPSLSYVSPDTTFLSRHKKQPWKLLCCNPRLESLPNTSTTQPRPCRRFPDQPQLIHPLRPLQDPPMHNIFQMDTTATCHVEPRYLKQPVPRGTYCNALYSIHSRYIYSPNQHIQITPTG